MILPIWIYIHDRMLSKLIHKMDLIRFFFLLLHRDYYWVSISFSQSWNWMRENGQTCTKQKMNRYKQIWGKDVKMMTQKHRNIACVGYFKYLVFVDDIRWILYTRRVRVGEDFLILRPRSMYIFIPNEFQYAVSVFAKQYQVDIIQPSIENSININECHFEASQSK